MARLPEQHFAGGETFLDGALRQGLYFAAAQAAEQWDFR